MSRVFDQQLDLITLTGVRGFGYHGVLEQERRTGQEFVVDVVLGVVSMSKAAKTDALRDTVDYAGVATAVLSVIKGEPMNLIERVAGQIAQRCLEFDLVRAVEVTVHKPAAPIPASFDDVSVTVTRAR